MNSLSNQKYLSSFLIRWRYLLFIVGIAVAFYTLSGAKYMQFAADYEIWFSEDNLEIKDFNKLNNIYTKSDNIVILLTPDDGDVFTSSTLSAVEWLTNRAWKIPFSTRVDSISNFQHTYSNEEGLVVEDLVKNAQGLGQERIQQIKNIALNEPLLVNRSISKGGNVTAVNVTLNLPKDMPEGSPKATMFAESLVEEMKQAYPGIQTHITGLVAMDNAFLQISQKDMGSLTLIMFGIIILALVVILRNISGVIVLTVLMFLSILATMGFSGWAGYKLTPPSANSATIVMTVSIAIMVHLLVSFLANLRKGNDKKQAIQESISTNFMPITLATLTTIVGFLTFNLSDIPPFHHLGNMVSAGVAVSYVLAFTVLPTLVILFPFSVKASKMQSRLPAILSEFVIKNHTNILITLSIVAVVLVMLIPLNKVDDEVSKYFDTSVQFRQDTDYASENLTGPYYLEFSLETGKTGGVYDPQYLNSVELFKKWLVKQDKVVHVSAITDILKRLNKNLHDDDDSMYSLPENYESSAQYFLLYEMSLPYGLDLNNQVDLDKSSTRVIVSLQNLSSTQLIAFSDKANAWLKNNFPSISVTSGSPMYMFSHIGQRSVENISFSLPVALTLISLLILVSLRSMKIGLLSLVPNLLPPAMAVGVWALISGRVGFSLAISISMVIGIIVDDTVHFLVSYLRARRHEGATVEDSIRKTFSTVGVALTVTTLVLICGFSVLTLSAFQLNSELGQITVIAISIALILDFLLLPSLLMLLDKNKQGQESYEKEGAGDGDPEELASSAALSAEKV